MTASYKETWAQGVYDQKSQTVYLLDLMSWDEESFLNMNAEYRLQMLAKKLADNPSLGTISGSSNELQFRVPEIFKCTTQNLRKVYYGLFTQFNTPTFELKYGKLVNYATKHELVQKLKLTSEEIHTEGGAKSLCTSLGIDNQGEFYIKDGIAFVLKTGSYALGYTKTTLQWKDGFISRDYDDLLKFPMTAHLLYDREGNLRTHDDVMVFKPAMEELKTNQVYSFTYEGVKVTNSYVILTDLKVHKIIQSSVWSSFNELIFKVIARKNLIPYKVLEQDIAEQETSITK